MPPPVRHQRYIDERERKWHERLMEACESGLTRLATSGSREPYWADRDDLPGGNRT